jgi:NifU-like protein involved in Fe-S cluster formation
MRADGLDEANTRLLAILGTRLHSEFNLTLTHLKIQNKLLRLKLSMSIPLCVNGIRYYVKLPSNTTVVVDYGLICNGCSVAIAD